VHSDISIPEIAHFYGLKAGKLAADLKTMKHLFAPDTKPSFMNIVEKFKTISCAQRSLITEAENLLRIVLVMPATNATSERCFSALRRMKTYLRSTQMQSRLNSLSNDASCAQGTH
jgi:hypothetical protein